MGCLPQTSNSGLMNPTATGRPVNGGRNLTHSDKTLIDVAQEKILSLAEETKFAANGIVSRTLLRTVNSRVVLFGFAEGQELSEHTSTQSAVIQILSGECEISLAGKTHAVKAGQLIYMPPNMPHAVSATKQFSMLLTLSKPETFSAKP